MHTHPGSLSGTLIAYFTAAYSGDLATLSMLIEPSSDIINSKTLSGDSALHVAVSQGQLATIEYLIEKGIEINYANSAGYTALHLAVNESKLDIIRYLIKKGIEANCKNNFGDTALHIAVYQGNLPVTQCLIKGGVNLNCTNEYGDTPLHLAVGGSPIRIVEELLVQEKIDVTVKNSRGRTPLKIGIDLGRIDAVKLLLEKEAATAADIIEKDAYLHCATDHGNVGIVKALIDIDANVDSRNAELMTPLLTAALVGHADVVKLLLLKKADIHAQNPYKSTALHMAAKNGHIQVARLLLRHGADINAKGECELTALHIAAKSNYIALVKLFLENGADDNAKGKYGITPLHLAVRAGYFDVARLLLEHGADGNAQESNGVTPLHSAVKMGDINQIKLLIEHHVDINAKEENGITPLHITAREGIHIDVAYLLLKSGADSNAKENDGATSLHNAVKRNDIGMVELLLENGADVDASIGAQEKKVTPLHVAAMGEDITVVKLLLDRGANVNAQEDKGLTPLHIAAIRWDTTLVKLLLESGGDIEIKDRDGNAILDLAAQPDYVLLKKVLIERNKKVTEQAIIPNAKNIASLLGVESEKISNITCLVKPPANKKKGLSYIITGNSSIEITYRLKSKETADNLFNKLKGIGLTPSRLGDLQIIVSYPQGVLLGGKEYTEYLKAVENKKNQNDVPKPVPGIINQSIKKKEQPLEQPQKADRISPPQAQDRSAPTTTGIFYKSLAPGQELSEDDKKQAKETLILSKVGEQLKLHLCYEEVWEEIVLLKDSEWLGKARKIITGSNSLEFEPQLKITTKFDADLVQQLKLKAHEHLAGRKAQNRLNASDNRKNRTAIPEKQQSQTPLKQTTVQPAAAKQKRGAQNKQNNQSLLFFGDSASSSDHPALSTAPDNSSVVKERDTAPTASRNTLNPVVGHLPRPPKSTAGKAVSRDDAASGSNKREIPAMSHSAAGHSSADESGAREYNSYYCLKRLPNDATFTFGNKPSAANAPKAPTTSHSAASQSWANESDVGSISQLKKMHRTQQIDRNYIIRAIYYWVIRAFVNKGINREQEPELWKLRNFLIHEFYIDCPWREAPEKEKFLLALAATLSTGGRPSSQIPDTCCSVSTSPNLLLERMNTELEALKSAFKSFATGGGLAQAFFSYYPERLGSCYASLIIIVECYNQLTKMGFTFLPKEKDILEPCRYKIRNKAVHVSNEQLRGSVNSEEIDMPDVQTLYKTCSTLYEKRDDFKAIEPSSPLQEASVPSSRPHGSSQPRLR